MENRTRWPLRNTKIKSIYYALSKINESRTSDVEIEFRILRNNVVSQSRNNRALQNTPETTNTFVYAVAQLAAFLF